jgi:hypothetical protein
MSILKGIRIKISAQLAPCAPAHPGGGGPHTGEDLPRPPLDGGCVSAVWVCGQGRDLPLRPAVKQSNKWLNKYRTIQLYNCMCILVYNIFIYYYLHSC